MSEEDLKLKYQKVIKWLLNNVNPELEGIQIILTKLSEISNIPQKLHIEGLERTPADLGEVLKQMEEVEESIILITKKLVPNFVPTPKNSDSEANELNEEDKFEKIFMKLLPKIDSSLSTIEEATFTINNNISHIQLEPIPSAIKNQTPMQRQVRFVDKAKRIHNNLKMLEESLSFQLKEILSESKITKLLYSPPDWSTPPLNKFYLEVREAEILHKKISINKSGHYLIGRLPVSDIIIDDVTCSRQHAVIQFRPGDPNPITNERTDEVYIFDLGSTSGTYVNGTPLQPNAYYPLFTGDYIQFGQYPSVFILRDGNEPGLTIPDTFDAPYLSTVVDLDQDKLKNNGVSNAISDLDKAIKQTHLNGIDNVNNNNNNNSNNIIKEMEHGDYEKSRSGSLSSEQPEIIQTRAKSNTICISDPKSEDFDKDEYKRKMIEAYEMQQKENEEILRRKKEREAQGLPAIIEIPYVPERPKKNPKKKKFSLF